MSKEVNSAGRKENAAEPAGKTTALGGEGAVARTGEKSQTRAGPDGGDASAVADTFKRKPVD